MTVQIVGLREVQENMFVISRVLDTEQTYNLLWDIGEEVRRACQIMADTLIYNTPESKDYKRTRYLRESIYINTAVRSDRLPRHALAYGLAEATYPGRPSNAKTYRMFPNFIPFRNIRAVRVTAGAIYANYVEYGHGPVPARPFMRNGMDSSRSKILSMTENGIRQLVSVASKGRAVGRLRNAKGQFMKNPVP